MLNQYDHQAFTKEWIHEYCAEIVILGILKFLFILKYVLKEKKNLGSFGLQDVVNNFFFCVSSEVQIFNQEQRESTLFLSPIFSKNYANCSQL